MDRLERVPVVITGIGEHAVVGDVVRDGHGPWRGVWIQGYGRLDGRGGARIARRAGTVDGKAGDRAGLAREVCPLPEELVLPAAHERRLGGRAAGGLAGRARQHVQARDARGGSSGVRRRPRGAGGAGRGRGRSCCAGKRPDRAGGAGGAAGCSLGR